MSYRVASMEIGAFEAHNAQHEAWADLEAGNFVHNDGLDYDLAAVADTLTGGSPTTLAMAVNVFNAAKALYHRHLGRYTTGRRLLAHIAQDVTNLIAATDMSSGSAAEAAIVAARGPICLELLTILKNQMTNVGGVWHTAPDLFNSVGTLPAAINTKALLHSWTIILRAVYEAHRVYGAGVEHIGADSTNTVIAPPPDSENDFDGILGVLVEVADELEDHVEDISFHAAVMAVTPTVAAYPAGLFTLSIEFKADFNLHIDDLTYHEVQDTVHVLSYADPTSIALLITAAQEVYVDLPAHIADAPTSAALRTAA